MKRRGEADTRIDGTTIVDGEHTGAKHRTHKTREDTPPQNAFSTCYLLLHSHMYFLGVCSSVMDFVHPRPIKTSEKEKETKHRCRVLLLHVVVELDVQHVDSKRNKLPFSPFCADPF